MKKTLASVTIAASLLGGAAGAIVFAPSLVSAQTEIESDSATGEMPARGAWLAEVLDGLVDDGTLTADQADAVADAIAEARPARPDGHFGRGHGPGDRLAELSDLLGLEPAEIGEALRSGDSLADIATAQGVDPQVIIDAMVDEVAERLEAGVADGRIDEADAAEHLAEATERVTDVVNGEAPVGRPFGPGPGRFGERGDRPFGHGHFGDGTDDEPADA